MKLKEIGEFGFIDRIAPLGEVRVGGVVKGIGDDCAVLALDDSNYLLVTTDLLVEKVHFLMEWAPAEIIGAKALAVNLSDIAACGGYPRDAFISLAVPDRIEVEWLDGLYRGLRALAEEYDVNLLGGDTTGSKHDLVINVAVTGVTPHNEVLYRHTASPGDVIALTGPVGESAAGLEILLQGGDLPQQVKDFLIEAHLEPRPHVEQGRLLASSGACTAAIDVSDGLSSDLGHICRESGVRAIIYENQIPVSEELLIASERFRKAPMDIILSGGEDYCLLVALKPDQVEHVRKRAADESWDLVPIGVIEQGSGMEIVRNDGARVSLEPKGWDHFLE